MLMILLLPAIRTHEKRSKMQKPSEEMGAKSNIHFRGFIKLVIERLEICSSDSGHTFYRSHLMLEALQMNDGDKLI